jgi:hypothetical protein
MNRALVDMIGRTAMGAVAGAVAGAGVQLTWRSWIMPSECFETSRWLCAVWLDGDLFLYTLSWAIMAGMLLSGVLGLLKRTRAWTACWLGGAGWLVLWVVTGLLGLIPDEDLLAVMLVLVNALAGAFSVPRPALPDDEARSTAHGGGARDST